MKKFGSEHIKNVEKTYRQGENIHVHFLITWALVKSVILILGEREKGRKFRKRDCCIPS
jgi:hypothetical protein